MALIDQKALLAIDGGLSYIVHRYPDARESEGKPNRKFKVRQEKTASAGLKWHKDGFWMVTDFGGDSKGRNAIQICMLEDNCDFAQAIRTVAAFYNFAPEAAPSIQPGYNCWPARPEESEGLMTFAFKEFDLFDLRTVFAEHAWRSLGRTDEDRKKNAVTLCAYYHLKCLASYTYTKEGKTHEYSSNEQFPIFLWDEGDFKKLYKPRGDKKFRFQTYGEKPANFIHGLAQAVKKRAELEAKNSDGAKGDDDEESTSPAKKQKDVKLREIIYCSGGSDAINVAALGYNVVWPNSETAELQPADYKTMSRIAEQVYSLQDIDETGLRRSHELAMQYLELRTIYLPDALRERKDSRGNPCKDVRDFLGYSPRYAFADLVETALPYQFWDVEVARDKDGNEKIRFGRVQFTYQLNNVHAYNFLYRNGFARFASEKEKDGYFYVRVDKKVVKPVLANDIKNFIHGFLEERKMQIDLRNTMYRSPQLSESSLSNLPYYSGDFKSYDAHSQAIFFESAVWKVTRSGIDVLPAGTLDKSVWHQKVIRHRPKVLPPMFRIHKRDGRWDIDILDKSCMFFKFLMQTCRVHWRAELEDRLEFSKLSPREQQAYAAEKGFTETDLDLFRSYRTPELQKKYREENHFSLDGPLLTEEEVDEQKGHLINRIFTLGYMLHRFKNPAKPWAVFAMDNRMSEQGQSSGRSGKGLVAKALYRFLQKVQLDGRNPKLTDNPHIFENVGMDTDMVHIEDTNEYHPFNFYFSPLTSAMTVNPKNKSGFEINFEDSPKFWFDTNFGDRYTDQSSTGRKLYTVFGDYYHDNDGSYREIRQPKDDFGGKLLFQDFTEDDWNCFYNFMAQCLQFYLSTDEKIDPPMDNVSKRNLLSTMGDHFKDWADGYFAKESGRLDMLIIKDEALDDCMRSTKMKNLTSQGFKKSLMAWSKFWGYEFNPAELLNSEKRCIRSVQGKSTEMIYLRSETGNEINREIK